MTTAAWFAKQDRHSNRGQKISFGTNSPPSPLRWNGSTGEQRVLSRAEVLDQPQHLAAGIGEPGGGPGRFPGEVHDDIADPLDFQQSLADPFFNASTPLGHEEFVYGSPAVRHHDQYVGDPIAHAHIADVT